MGIEQKQPAQSEENDQPYWGVFDAVSDGLIIQDLETKRIVEANTAAAAMHGYGRQEFIGLPASAYIPRDGLQRFTESLQLVQSGSVFESPAIHVHRDGSPFYVEVRRTAFTYRSRPCILSIVRDVSKQVRAEQLLHQQAEVRAREQSTLLDISHTLASTLELKPDLILDQLRAIIRYRRAALFVLEDSALVAVAVRGVQETQGLPQFHIRLDGAETLARLFNEHRPILIADVWSTDDQAQFLRSLLGTEAPLLLDGVQAWMWVPLAVKGRIIGGIGVAHAKRDYFSKHHADLALTVANQAAVTLINAELHKNAQSLAVLQERQRLAQNLHDAVNQSLFSAGLIAEVLTRLWERDQDQARQFLEDLRRLTRGAMAEMRALLAELRPSTLTDSDLGDLLVLLANGFTGRTNVPAHVTMEGHGSLPAEVQVAIYRICQEALNNIAKHASASAVEISLKHEDSTAEIRIHDNGRGFDPGRVVSGHYGLIMMRERAEAVGAMLSITGEPGHGTELVIHWADTENMEVP
jgi:two-component system nitrate/nitrite sensor histidine kinase NarX